MHSVATYCRAALLPARQSVMSEALTGRKLQCCSHRGAKEQGPRWQLPLDPSGSPGHCLWGQVYRRATLPAHKSETRVLQVFPTRICGYLLNSLLLLCAHQVL